MPKKVICVFFFIIAFCSGHFKVMIMEFAGRTMHAKC